MTVDTEPTLTITTEKTEVESLREGDLLHYAFPAPHFRVVDNKRGGHLLAPNRRNAVTLVDSEGVEQQFRLSPKRKVNRVTNPAVPTGPWFFGLTGTDISDDLRSWQREDALWYRALWPVAKPFVRLWREILDLQCRAYSLKYRMGFWGVLAVVIVAAVGLATKTEPELTVAIGIVGAFIVERCWEQWRAKTRRKLAKGVTMRVRTEPYGPARTRYRTLELRPRGAVILGEQLNQTWFSTEMRLREGKRLLARCAFANDIKSNLTNTNSAVAEAIRHRLDNGSSRVIYTSSPKHDPATEALPDIKIFPSDRSFALHFADHETNKRFSVKLKLHQARILADVLEIMDEGRRL